MAYNSTEGMSTSSTLYNTAQPPRVQSISERLGNAPAVFAYRSTHAHGDIEAAGFFADGKRHGLQVGDVLMNIPYSTDGTSAVTMHAVSASTGAIAASDTAGSSAWNQAYNVSVGLATT